MKRLLLLLIPSVLAAQPLKLEGLEKLASKAKESVNVSLDASMLRLASRFLTNDGPEEAQVKKLVAGLKGLYVRSFEFSKEGQYQESDVEAIRNQLRDPKWKRVVEVRGRESADICIRQEGENYTGMAIISAEPTELTVVYVDGPIDLDGLTKLAGSFGIPESVRQKVEKKSK